MVCTKKASLQMWVGNSNLPVSFFYTVWNIRSTWKLMLGRLLSSKGGLFWWATFVEWSRFSMVFHLIWNTSHVFIRILYIPSGSPDFSSLPEGFNVSDFPRASVAALFQNRRFRRTFSECQHVGTLMLHVWNIYLHLPHVWPRSVSYIG